MLVKTESKTQDLIESTLHWCSIVLRVTSEIGLHIQHYNTVCFSLGTILRTSFVKKLRRCPSVVLLTTCIWQKRDSVCLSASVQFFYFLFCKCLHWCGKLLVTYLIWNLHILQSIAVVITIINRQCDVNVINRDAYASFTYFRRCI